MANIKKPVDVIKEENKANEDNTNKETIKKIDEKDEQLLLMRQQLEELQRALIKMQSNQTTTSSNELFENEIEICGRFVNGISIYSPNKEVIRDIPFNGSVTVDEIELSSLLKSNFVRDFLEKDIIYFKDESIYKKKKIKKKYELDNDSFTDMIMNNSTDKVVEIINTMTKNMKDDPMIHCVFYRIVELCYEGKLTKMPHTTRKELEKIFEFKIDDAQSLFRGFVDIK
jgi:hypothetical protein